MQCDTDHSHNKIHIGTTNLTSYSQPILTNKDEKKLWEKFLFIQQYSCDRF